MPITDPSVYPPYWKQFSEYIRFDRAGGICECTGECGRNHLTLLYGLGVAGKRCTAINGQFGKIGRDGIWRPTDSIHALQSDDGLFLYPDFDFIGSKVVLTVAHLDFDGGICTCKKDTGFKCANPEHNLAMCQSCHLMMDKDTHIANAALSRQEKKDAARELFRVLD